MCCDHVCPRYTCNSYLEDPVPPAPGNEGFIDILNGEVHNEGAHEDICDDDPDDDLVAGAVGPDDEEPGDDE